MNIAQFIDKYNSVYNFPNAIILTEQDFTSDIDTAKRIVKTFTLRGDITTEQAKSVYTRLNNL